MSLKRLYFDYAATTPVAPEVVRAMLPYFGERFGNPGSLHSYGQEAVNALDRARDTMAAAIGCSFREVVFTSSATEANNLGIVGTLRKFREDHPEVKRPRAVLSTIEHRSAVAAIEAAGEDIDIVYIPVGENGRVSVGDVLAAVNADTALVFLMYGHNEIGTVQSVEEIARGIEALRAAGKTNARFHTDAVQAFGYLACRVDDLGVDLMTLSAQKIYGPKGVALLYVRGLDTPRSIPVSPLVQGGGQEFGLRSGTENVPAIVGFAAATELLLKKRDKEAVRVQALKEQCWKEIKKALPKAQVNGPLPDAPLTKALPHILNIYLPGCEAQDVLTALDLAGIAVSAGSACSARSLEPSKVIKQLNYSDERSRQSIRISFGRETTKAHIRRLVVVLAAVAKQ